MEVEKTLKKSKEPLEVVPQKEKKKKKKREMEKDKNILTHPVLEPLEDVPQKEKKKEKKKAKMEKGENILLHAIPGPLEDVPQKEKKKKKAKEEEQVAEAGEEVKKEKKKKRKRSEEDEEALEVVLQKKKKIKAEMEQGENILAHAVPELLEDDPQIEKKKKKKAKEDKQVAEAGEDVKKEKKKKRKRGEEDEEIEAPSQEKKKKKKIASEEVSTKEQHKQREVDEQEQDETKENTNPLNIDETKENTNPLNIVETMFNKEEYLQQIMGNQLFQSLERMGFTKLTSIQFRTYPHISTGKDVVGVAKTGSGKTLAFLLPVLRKLTHFPARKGTGAIVVSPTRELAQQTYSILKELAASLSLTHGIFLGDKNREEEARALEQGVCFIVATPGRLLDHLQNTPHFKFHKLRTLILDEADKLLESGFLPTIKQINKLLPKKKQTLMFTATMTSVTHSLATLVLKEKHVIISTMENSAAATVAGLQQAYMIKGAEERLPFLCQLLTYFRDHKVMVFFGSCRSTEFHHLLLSRWNPDLSLLRLHSGMSQMQRNKDTKSFREAKCGALLCTDVAGRGLDIVDTEMVIQYEPPLKLQNYIHRVGRTARGQDRGGSALLLLQPFEEPFLKKLSEGKVPISEHSGLADLEGDPADIQSELRRLVESDKEKLHDLAFLAFHAYYRHYRKCDSKSGFKMQNLKPEEVASFFVLPFVPQLVYELSEKKTIQRRKFKLPATTSR